MNVKSANQSKVLVAMSPYHRLRRAAGQAGGVNRRKQRVLVAMSGGVDSSVAAALLKEQGYDVTGGYMKNFSPESWEGVISPECPWERDMEDVARVCEKLDIPWRSFNFEEEYRDRIIEYFFREYAAGRTPNPDALCNSEIKFGIFLEKAMELGFDYIATGHYVRKRATADNKQLTSDTRGGRSCQLPDVRCQMFSLRGRTCPMSDVGCQMFSLYQAKDKNKDQSYFLYNLNQYQLSKSLFPLGDYTKPEVRALAEKFALHTAGKKDSQGVCFVGHIKLRDFLKQRIPEKQGDIVTGDGRTIGTHKGAAFYTIGQRQGIGLPGGPYYVREKDVKTNTLVVTKNPGELDEKECVIADVNWISGSEPQLPAKVLVKIRYQSPSIGAAVTRNRAPDTYNLQFEYPARALAVGQCAVLYTEEEEMLGGGVIERASLPRT